MSETMWKRARKPSSARHAWAVLGALALATPAGAELPDYTFELQARTNLMGNASGAYNLDPGNLLAGSLQIPITGDRQVAFRLSITPEGRSAVWWGKEGKGSRIYLLPDIGPDARTGDPGLNSAGDIAFGVADATNGANNGIYLLNAADPSKVRIIQEPLGVTDWQSLWLNEAGQLGFRALISGSRAYVLLSPKGASFEVSILAKEKSLDAQSPYEFLYSPTLNDQGQLAGVGDLAAIASEYFQELRLFNADGTFTTIARSRGLDSASPIYRFASVQPALNNHGQIAFQGTERTPAGKNLVTIWLWDGTALKAIAQSGQGEIQSIEGFPPDINDRGLVVFRAIDTAGLRAVWVSDGQALKRVMSEHELVPSDLGTARVDQETPSSPVFAGSPLINARGDVTIAAGLAPPDNDQVEWGTAIYVAQSSLSPPQNPDGGSDGGIDQGSDGGIDGGVELPDAGFDAGSEETPDASVDAGSEATPDAGPKADAGPGETPDAGTAEPPPVNAPESGCGCQSTPAVALWPLLLLGLARYLSIRRRTSP